MEIIVKNKIEIRKSNYGEGMFAKKQINKGEIIYQEKTAYVCNNETEMIYLIKKIGLPKDIYYWNKLECEKGNNQEKCKHIKCKIMGKIKYNAFKVIGRETGKCNIVLGLEISKFNHKKERNALHEFEKEGKIFLITVKAEKRIKKNEEIFINYIEDLKNPQERKRRLKQIGIENE